MKEYYGLENNWWLPASLFFALILVSDIPTALSVLYFFVATVYIPGHFVVFFLFGKEKSESLLFLPAGFALIPLLAYISGIFFIPLVSPLVPPIFSLLCLVLMHRQEELERIKARIRKTLVRGGLP